LSKLRAVTRNGGGYFQTSVEGVTTPIHRIVWEHYHGPIPQGWDVHHRNEDRTDNAPDNLELLKRVDHVREHQPSYARNEDGEWVKTCAGPCGQTLPMSSFQLRKRGGYLRHACRSCETRRKTKRGKLGLPPLPACLPALSPEQVEAIRAERAVHGTYIRVLAERFGVSFATIQRLLSGRTYKSASGEA
jgi:hypothetical protein